MPSRFTRTLLAIACTTLLFGALFSSSAAARKHTLKLTAPKAGVVAYGKIPVRAKLNVTRSSRVVRARFYIGKKRVTTDRRYPFTLKKSVRFDTRSIPAWGRTLKLTVRYEQRTKSGRLKRRKLIKKVRLKLDSSGDVGQLGGPDPGPGGGTGDGGTTDPTGPTGPTNPNTCAAGMLLCEEFDGTSLNRAIWNDQRNDAGAGNYPWFAWNAGMEGAHYSTDNVKVGDGVVTLSVSDVPSGVVPGYPQHQRPKSTGSINTNGKFAFQYGTMEARIKFDECEACWQSFWLHNIGSGNRPEYDVMEHMPWADASPFTVLHGLVGPPPNEYGEQTGNETLNLAGHNNNLSGTWHTYRITRAPDFMKITIDGNPAWSFRTEDPNLATSNEMFPILSMAIIDATIAADNYNLHVTPAPAGTKMQVDYLRVWSPGFGPDS